jgi:pyruvate kinase
MKKRTKIVATIGPSSESKENIQSLIESGVNVFRFNTKHNTSKWHAEKMELVKKVSSEMGVHVGILVDLQGPDIRIGKLSAIELDLKDGDIVYLEEKITRRVSIELSKKYIKSIRKGQEIIIDDGRVILKTLSVENGNAVKAKVVQGDLLHAKKGVFFPGLKIDSPALTKRDKEYIKLAAKIDADFLAISFVRDTNDLKSLKYQIDKYSGTQQIVSKIETLQAVKNIDSIVEMSDIIMVARGDLGVEMYLEAVPLIQKRLIKKCIKSSKPVIVATQMLKSMIENPHPSRAEISDIANAGFDSADAVMLSEESAIGKYPAKAVGYMSKTLKYNEMESVFTTQTNNIDLDNSTKAIVSAADALELNLNEAGQQPKYFIVLTESGKTAGYLSATRPSLPILAFTQSDSPAQKLSLSWGVEAHTITFDKSLSATIKKVKKQLKKMKYVEKGDTAIVISGQNIGKVGQTDSIRVVTF